MRLLLAGVSKLRHRPATWITLLFLVAITALIYIAVGASARQVQGAQSRLATQALLGFPGAYRAVIGFLLGLGGLLAVIYGAAVAGSEWSWGTLKAAVARGESRARYVLLTFAAVALLIAVGLLIAFVAGVAFAALGATLAGLGTAGLGDASTIQSLPDLLVRGWFGLVEEAAIGFAVATITRSQLAGIAIGIGMYFGEQFSVLLIPDVVRYLPFNAASALIPAGDTSGVAGRRLVHALDPTTALLVVAGWLLLSALVASLLTERAEIGG